MREGPQGPSHSECEGVFNLEKKVLKVFETVGAIAVIVLAVTILIQVIFREIFRIPTTWSVEFGRLMFNSLVFLGAGIDIAEEKHLGVEMVKDAFRDKPKAMLVFEIVGDIVTYLFLFTLAYGCFKKTFSEWSTQVPSVEWLRYGEFYLIMFIGTLGMLYFQFMRTGRYLKKFKKKEKYTTLSILADESREEAE